MSKEPATPPYEGGEPSSRSRGANAAPSQPGTRRSRHAGVQSEKQAVQGPLHDGAGTSSAMAAQGGPGRHVSLVLPQEGVVHPGQPQERPYRGDERPPPPGHGHDGVTQQPAQAGRPKPRPSYVPPSQRRREQEEQPYAGPPSWAPPQRRREQEKPYAAPPQRRREQEQPHAPPPLWPPLEEERPMYPHGGFQEERLATRLPQGGASPVGVSHPMPREDAPSSRKPFVFRKKKTKITTVSAPEPPVAAHDARPQPDQQHAPGEASAPPGVGGLATAGGAAPPAVGALATPPAGGAAPPGVGTLTTPAGAAPPGGTGLAAPAGAAPSYGGSTTATGRAPSRGRFGFSHTKSIQRVPTMVDFKPENGGVPPQQTEAEYPRATPTGPLPGRRMGRASPMFLQQRKKKRRPVAIFFTLCCILFWLLVVALGVVVLLMYLVYHPQPPRLRVTTATLNAGYVDQLPPPHTGLALNSDLSVLATIYNPNTKIDVLLRYMQLDLYFGGVMIGTQAVWPPILARPGETQLRDVHIVVSEVSLSPENAEAWRNATAKGGLVEVILAARFHVQLDFGRWFPFRYWVRPSCALWLDPPPGGALRRARCHKSTV